MKGIIYFFLIFYSTISYCQNIKTENILNVADSILTTKIGKNLKNNFSVSEGSYYKFTSSNGKVKTGKFLSKRKLNKNVTEIWVNYHFNYPEIENVSGAVWIKLNEKLKLIEDLKLEFVPSFLLNNEKPNFITIEQAEIIAKTSFLNKGFEISKAKLEFNRELKKYIYYLTNKLTKLKNIIGNDTGEFEIVQIDAVNGEVLNLKKGYYGIIIR